MVELNRYRAGELHTTRVIPPEMFQEMKNQRPAQVRVSPALGVYYFGFNMNDERLAGNRQLRQALSMAVDRETIVNITGRGEMPAYNWVPPGTNNFESQGYSWGSLSEAERHRRARQAYRGAGFSKRNPFSITIRYNTHDTHKRIAAAIQSMWRDVLGVEVTLINEEFQVLLDNLRQDNFEVFRMSWDGDYNDAHTFLTIVESDNSLNFPGYSSEEFDGLMADAAKQVDPVTRKAYLEEAERAMLRDYPLIPVYFLINRSMVSPKVSGWGDNVLNYHYSQHLSLAVDE
jgi:oligopeptide transport system substrate-binding protein